MSGGVLVQAVVSGMATGGVYALIAMGFALCWSLTRTFALAQGDIAIGSVLLAVAAIVGATPIAVEPAAGESVVLALLALIVGATLGGLAYVAAVRPTIRTSDDGSHRGDAALTWAAGLLVVGLALRAATGAIFSGSGVSVPDPLHLALGASQPISLPGGGDIEVRSLAVIAVAALASVLLDRLLVSSRWGRRLAAVADNPGLARLCGIAADRETATAFAVTGVMAALAGLLAAPGQAVVSTSGVQLGLAGAAAAMFWRVGSVRGAAFVAVGLGIVQQVVESAGGAGVTISDLLPSGLLVLAALAPRHARPRLHLRRMSQAR